MKPLDFPLQADENIHPGVIAFLRKTGLEVASIAEQEQFGLPDANVLKQAADSGKVVLTHDRDFGGLALLGAKFVGIIYLRPGHIQADFTIKTLQSIRDNAPDVVPPFILVAERTGDTVKIRVRQM